MDEEHRRRICIYETGKGGGGVKYVGRLRYDDEVMDGTKYDYG